MNKLTIKSVITLFPTPADEMPKLSTPGSRPSYTTLKLFQDKLNSNAMAIPSQDTKLGHLGLVLDAETYKQVNNGKEWTEPTKPNEKPSKPRTESAFHAHEAIRQWQHQADTYTTFLLTQEALKNQILKNVDDEYINALSHKVTKYSQVTPIQLLNHLWKYYGTIEESDLMANDERMKAPWNPPTPIEELYKQLRKGQDFATQGDAEITDSQLQIGYALIYKTGMFEKACSKWRERTKADKTWEKFQKFFSKGVNDYLKNNTAEDAQYSAAQVQEIFNQNIAALTATTPELTSDPEHSPTNSETTPPHTANAITASDIETIVTAVLQGKGKGQSNSATTTGNDTKKKKQVQVAQGFNSAGDPISYCWLHGITKNLRHNSMTCKRKKEGHQDKATLNNKMNGSEQVCKKRE